MGSRSFNPPLGLRVTEPSTFFPVPPSPPLSSLFWVYLYFCLHSILFSISFRCTAQWLDNHTSPTWHHTQLLQCNIIDCIPSLCSTLHPHGYFVTTDLYFLTPSPFSPSPQPPSPQATTSLFSLSVSPSSVLLGICDALAEQVVHLGTFGSGRHWPSTHEGHQRQ